MRSASNCKKLHRYLLPVALICLLVALVSFSGCITELSRLSGISLPMGFGSSTGTANPPAYDTSQAQATQTQATGTSAGSCRQGLTPCADSCVDMTVDIGNCGGCGKVCPTHAHCNEGACYCKDGYEATAAGTCIPATAPAAGTGNTGQNQQYSCADHPGMTACDDGYCWWLTEDNHCGSCGNACPIDQACTNGQCVSKTAQTNGNSPSQTDCNGQQNVDLMTDNVNCGACGIVCDGCKPCVQGSCQYQVGVCGYCTQNNDCAGLPTPPIFIAAHLTWVCKNTGEQNACMPVCQKGFTLCGSSTCVNTQTDANNCGSCGNACKGTCTNGKCDPVLAEVMRNYPDIMVRQCSFGLTNCGTDASPDCVNLKTDRLHCGSCGNNNCIVAGSSCCDGTCLSAAKLMSDTSNCGSCGTTCPAGQSCINGQCGCPTAYPVYSNGACTRLAVVVNPILNPIVRQISP